MGTNLRRDARNESAIQFATRMKVVRDEVEASLKKANQTMKDNYDRHKKTSPDFKPGDLVLLNTKNMRTTRAMKKLENLRDGPFKVLKKVGASAYTLEIPDTWKKAGIHPTFNEKLVTPYHAPSFPSQQKPPPPPPVVVNEQEEYEVQKILDSKMRWGKVHYLVKWKGYSDAHNEWVPSENCDNAKEAVKDFHKKFPAKPRPRSDNSRCFIPLTPELRSLMKPVPTPLTEPVSDSLPTELQLNRLSFKMHRGRCI